MYLPLSNFIESDSVANISSNSGIQVIDSSYVTLLQNKQFHMLQSKGDVHKFSIPSPLDKGVSQWRVWKLNSKMNICMRNIYRSPTLLDQQQRLKNNEEDGNN